MLMSWPGLAVFTAFVAFTAVTAFAGFTFSTFAPLRTLAFTSFVNFPLALFAHLSATPEPGIGGKNRQGMSEVVGAHSADHL